ncbi:MAG: hypothetical protein AB1758_25700 [Candidatus Eremiobacterota bacterium]
MLALIFCLLQATAWAVPLEFQLLDWQPGDDPELQRKIREHFKLDLEKMPTLRQQPDGLTLQNRGGAPVATAYAPVEMARGTFTLLFEARSDSKRRAAARFASERLELEASPEWRPGAVTVESLGPMGPSGVAFSLLDREGTLEVRGLTLLRLAFRARVRVLPELVVRGGDGSTLVGVQMAVAGDLPEGITAEFRVLPVGRWRDPPLADCEPIGVITEKDARDVAVTWAARVPPLGTVFVREPIEPSLLRWQLVDAQGQVVHAGGELRLGPTAPRPPPPATGRVSVREDGVLVVDGRPWFPMGLYTHSEGPEALEAVRGLGLNLAILSQTDQPAELVSRARAQGIEVIMATRMGPDQTDLSVLPRRYPDVALLAWYFVDEPDLKPEYFPVLESMYVSLARADPRPVYQANHTPASLAFCSQAADILALDPYPLSTQPSPVATVGAWMDRARGVLPPARGLWYINQSFALAPLWNSPPSPEQLRCMNWIALNHGARGIVYYSLKEVLAPGFPEHRWNLLSSPLAEMIRRQSAELMALSPFFLAPQGPVPVDLDGPVDAAVFQDGRGQLLLSLVNVSDRAVSGTLILGRLTELQELPDQGSRRLVEGRLEFALSPYQVRLYTWDEKAPAAVPPKGGSIQATSDGISAKVRL